MPAVPAAEKPEKRSRKKGGAIQSEDCGAARPETRESQDVEMAESQDADVPVSQAATETVVDSRQESQATEVIAAQEEGSPEPIDWPPSPPPMGEKLPDEICSN